MLKYVPAASVPLAFLLATTALAADATTGTVLKGADAFTTWQQDKPGVTRIIKPADLPAPFVTPSASNTPAVDPRPADARPIVAAGFNVDLVASGLEGPRVIRVAPNGDIFVADSVANNIHVYRMKDGSSQPAGDSIFADGLNQPYGIAFYPQGNDPQWVYVANTDSVVRYPYRSGDLKAAAKPETIVANIPSEYHWTRDIAFSPDGSRMFLSVGSGSNVGEDVTAEPQGGIAEWAKTEALGQMWGDEDGRADVLSFNPDGKDRKVVATGIRNCSGMTVQPATGALWCVTNERDGLGDNLVPDYATTVQQGHFYGWPWYYIGANEDPRAPLKGQRPDLASQVTVPDVLFEPHSAPLNITFYEGSMFPAEYKGDAFVAMHGSWNRGDRTGYKVVRMLFDQSGKPTGEYQDFMTGFVESATKVWGRPVGVAVAHDGSLLVSEDGSGTIWRVSAAPNPS